ncbi:MAG TPA: biotin/lipoyl-containing protein [Oscillatoriaceae cyanobacterium]
MRLKVGDREIEVRLGREGIELDGVSTPLHIRDRERSGGSWVLTLELGGTVHRLWVTPLLDGSWAVQAPGGVRTVVSPARAADAVTALGPIKSPLAGVVVEVCVAAGDRVAAGAPLAIVEAMKTRTILEAPAPARVADVRVAARALVSAGQVLVVLEADETQ